jgi:hypothetical protein
VHLQRQIGRQTRAALLQQGPEQTDRGLAETGRTGGGIVRNEIDFGHMDCFAKGLRVKKKLKASLQYNLKKKKNKENV